MARACALVAASIALAVTIAACGGGGDDNKGSSSTQASGGPGTLTTGAPEQPAPSGGGSLPKVAPPQRLRTSATLDAASAAGRPLTKLKVTVVRFQDNVKPGFLQAPAVQRAHMTTVQITLKNVGFAVWSGNPSADAVLITTRDQQARPFTVGGGCVSGFATKVELLPGETQRGCLAFILNRGAKPKLFQFSPNFPNTPPAEWRLRK